MPTNTENSTLFTTQLNEVSTQSSAVSTDTSAFISSNNPSEFFSSLSTVVTDSPETHQSTTHTSETIKIESLIPQNITIESIKNDIPTTQNNNISPDSSPSTSTPSSITQINSLTTQAKSNKQTRDEEFEDILIQRILDDIRIILKNRIEYADYS